MILDPGEMDQRIVFRTDTSASDGQGGQVLTPSTVATVWAKVKAKRGGENENFDRVNASAAYEFWTHYRSDITVTMRIVWGGEEYNIRDIPKLGGRQLYSLFVAERGVAQ